MSILDRLQNIPIPIINLILILTIAVPLVYPLGIPLLVDPMTRSAYDVIEDMPEGSVVLFDYNVGPSTVVEVGASCKAMVYHMLQENLKVIFISSGVDGQMFVEQDVPPIAEVLGKEYGKDYVHLGYFAGLEMGAASILAEIGSTYTTDYRNTPIEDIELLQTVTNHEQISLAIYSGGLGDQLLAWVRQANTAYGIETIIVPVGVCIAYALPYYPTQVSGIVGSLRGGAEYELLVSRPGEAIAGMDSLSLSFIWLMVLIILCNIGVISSRLSGRSS
jgi:hypothetical protein